MPLPTSTHRTYAPGNARRTHRALSSMFSARSRIPWRRTTGFGRRRRAASTPPPAVPVARRPPAAILPPRRLPRAPTPASPEPGVMRRQKRTAAGGTRKAALLLAEPAMAVIAVHFRMEDRRAAGTNSWPNHAEHASSASAIALMLPTVRR